MIFNSYLSLATLQAGHIRRFSKDSILASSLRKSWSASWCSSYSSGYKFTKKIDMMVDTSGNADRGPLGDMSPEKEENGGYACGGWKSEDQKLSCGYSSFRGKRASMEDFFDVKTSKIDGKTVSMFGIFDGHGGSRAAEYLKENLFDKLMKHPKFIVDPKLAISETYKQTDMDFLDSEKETYRDDGSTASSAVLVGNHLYVANVGDSRTVISKGGKGMYNIPEHLCGFFTYVQMFLRSELGGLHPIAILSSGFHEWFQFFTQRIPHPRQFETSWTPLWLKGSLVSGHLHLEVVLVVEEWNTSMGKGNICVLRL